MQIEDNDRMLSDWEYRQILNFILEIRAAECKIPNILRRLNKSFGCACSSYWAVRDDYSMADPIGANISPRLLSDYEKGLFAHDDLYLKQMDETLLSERTILECQNIISHTKATPYTLRLEQERIRHKYSIIIREQGKIRGAIALFESLDNRMCQDISPRSLEIIAPFITQELIAQKVMDRTQQILSILQTVLSSSETGIALFDRSNIDNIAYFNPICTKYCFDFLSAGNPNTVVAEFLKTVVAPFDRPYPRIKDLSVDLSTPSGNIYRIRVLDNSTQIENMCTLFITPKDILKMEESYQRLFSQLTPKEREITLLISQGLTNNEIAERLTVSLSTVKSHIQHIFDKADVSNRTSLMALLNNID